MVLVIGRSGQLARALADGSHGPMTFLDRELADLEHPEKLREALASYRPSLIINAAAYTAVDLAETEAARALAINADSVGVLAEFAAAAEIPLIHFSTDYVYSGGGDQPHLETEAPQPINAYGASKRRGEQLLLARGAKALIFRTSWVYSPFGKNFVRTMLAAGAARERLNVVSDQVGSPTSALDLAQAVWSVVETLKKPGFREWGIYNLAGSGEVSWQGFAKEIFAQARELGFPLKVSDVRAIATADYPTPARRPLNSRLNQDKLARVFGIRMPPWQESLRRVLEMLIESH